MLKSMSTKELLGWEAYYQLEPLGDERLDWLVAGIREMVCNIQLAPKDRKPLDYFLLKFGEEAARVKKAPQTFEEQIAIAHIWALTMANSKDADD